MGKAGVELPAGCHRAAQPYIFNTSLKDDEFLFNLTQPLLLTPWKKAANPSWARPSFNGGCCNDLRIYR